ncbi:MAG: 50S ribosomal protein L25/general stress protein Ctc [Minwuiales bacterium]|nr:50S ribosomal protein L25/general stress protein Ctc [Minwuiales bacterium]
MADIDQIEVQDREKAGKGASRALRRAGLVPGIVYGDNKEPTNIALDRVMLEKHLHSGGFTSKLFELQLGSRKQRVLPREIQLHPVTDRPLHVDFLRIAAGAELAIEVAVNFVNEEECEGLKQGGVLNVVRHTVELLCPADAIPEFIEVDLKGYEIGDSVHIGSVKLPDGVTPTITDRDFTIATIAAPTVHAEAEEEAEGEEAAEGEAPAEGEAAEAAEKESSEGGES